ncbi:MAG: DUF1963 domain-containing protein [Roseiarcus sp.]
MPRSLPRTRDEFLSSLNETELPENAVARLAARARPAVLLTTAPADEGEIPLGASKLGGAPDLPRGTAWPERPPYPDAPARAGYHRKHAARLLADSKKPGSWMTPKQGERYSLEALAMADAIETSFPLAFFGQFDLASLSAEQGFDTAFPSEGRLLLFYDYWVKPEEFTPEASVGWLLLWDRSPVSGLARASIPNALSVISTDEWNCVFRPARIGARTVLTPMPPNDKSWDAFSLDDDEALTAYRDWLSQFGSPDAPAGENHQFGGFPRPLQNGLQSRCQLAANGINCGRSEAWETDAAKELLEFSKDWRLVLQIGVDENAGIPEPGAYYVMMRDQDIAARRFDRARVTFQCD